MKKAFKHAKSFVVIAFLLAGVALGAQEAVEGSEIDMDLDTLFGEEVVEIASDAPAATGDPVTAALKSDKVRIGGSFSGSLTPTATWTSLWDGGSDLFDPDRKALSSSLKSTLFFDARPKEDFRVYGSAKTSWPFSTATTDSIEVPNISIFELFADFSMNDKLFFRFGKSTVKWGVGYFWSPADVINLEQINLLDAEAQREGPVNFRVHIPVSGTQNNFYMYTILDENSVAFETTALAVKAEFLLGNYELGLGAYYRYDTAERAMLTLTGPIGNLDVFGEAMVSRGSGKTFVTDIKTTPNYDITTSSTAENRENFYFSASTGFLYSNSNSNITAIGQYYYNGEGYSTATKDALVTKAKLAIASTSIPATAAALSASLAGLIYGSGQHYAALSFSKGELFTEDFSASVIAVANLSDWSGLVKPTFSYAVHDNLSIALSPTFFFGPAEGEYAFLAGGNIVSLSLGATVSGSF